MTKHLALAVLVFAVVIPGRATAEAGPVVLVGDHVYVQVFNHPELSGDETVGSDGTIAMPLIGPVTAAGMTTAALAKSIEHGLGRYVPYAAVHVERRAEGASITVSGWPFPLADGTIKYLPGQTLGGAITAIRAATGSVQLQQRPFDPYHSQINMRAVVMKRDGSTLGTYDMVALSAAGEAGPVLMPGDEVRFVNKPIAVEVNGDVRQPGFAYLSPDEPLSDALDQVYGFNSDAVTADLLLHRDGSTESVSLANSVFHEPAHAGDVLDVPTAPTVMVAGMVMHAGEITLRGDKSLLSAVFNAGGLQDKDADLGQITLIRDGVAKKYDVTAIARGELSQNPQLQDGDEVFVPRGHRIDPGIASTVISSLRWILVP